MTGEVRSNDRINECGGEDRGCRCCFGVSVNVFEEGVFVQLLSS